jgi:hypothetical protein
MSDQGFDDFGLVPSDESEDFDAEAALNAAEASALAGDQAVPEDEEPPLPLGASWAFDWGAGRFLRRGTSPARVTGELALIEWCMMALNSARGAHPVFSGEFGITEPQLGIGLAGEAAREAADDYRVAASDALLVHDRIAGVEMDVAYDPVQGVYVVSNLTVTTDDDDSLTLNDLVIARS